MPVTASKDQMKVYLAWSLASGYPTGIGCGRRTG
jgi:hypothetical protein